MNELKMLSKKSEFHLSKNRQREILYFVKQYPEFKQIIRDLDGFRSGMIKIDSRNLDDTLFSSIIFKRARILEKINIIEVSARETNDILWHYIIDSVVTDHSWDYYDQHFHIDCGRNTWYSLRREFLWRIDAKR